MPGGPSPHPTAAQIANRSRHRRIGEEMGYLLGGVINLAWRTAVIAACVKYIFF